MANVVIVFFFILVILGYIVIPLCTINKKDLKEQINPKNWITGDWSDKIIGSIAYIIGMSSVLFFYLFFILIPLYKFIKSFM